VNMEKRRGVGEGVSGACDAKYRLFAFAHSVLGPRRGAGGVKSAWLLLEDGITRAHCDYR
jgi:hypothetical protein